MQSMPHAVFLRMQIALIVLIWCNFDGNILGNLKSIGFESDAFHGIVGEQTHLMHTE